ncbi:MAG TPA: DHH family phosphoesterase [Leptospiraceae bacterium]|nr:DHH family phosphoesterase [Leptospirales bacterium]HMU85501.1 DHH family phosphoesterase [Leptospiraceae bacterium]HMW60196.1 DHH family phosphoesterase [Leptospiraceae bacterium]HMX54877.1 DHH family phosphoesterase [Leptospiraceae bacterium]HNE24303.1 DHH family phosphoesterase [Leptospiraceae bacterium]
MLPHNKLISSLGGAKQVYIQTHNFPDHDAVATAYGLQYFLKRAGIQANVIYEGEVQRDSLKRMIQELNIDVRPASRYALTAEDKIIVVDGCKGNKNVTDLIGDEVAVIDHHQVTAPDDVKFADIRPEYGACSSIIYEYLNTQEGQIPQNVATALMVGINMDTSLLTRSVSKGDLLAYTELYGLADMPLVNSILINYIQTKDLAFYKTALDRVRIKETLAFCYFPDGCNQNLMGILGDFFMSLQEIEFVALCAKNDGKINFSLRSENRSWNASKVIQEVLEGVGFGGGHNDRAGGIIQDAALFHEEEIYKKVVRALKLPDIAIF